MDKYFVTHSQAVALKELGFDMPCIATYTEGTIGKGEELQWFVSPQEDVNNDFTFVAAPLKSQVFEWFRKKGYDAKVQKESEGLYFGFYWTGAAWIIVGNGSYEESESACIDKLIDIVKQKL